MAESPSTKIESLGLLTVKQVASLVQLSSRAIWRLRSKGWIPNPIQVGGAVRWRRTEVEDWIRDGCPKGCPK